MGKLITIAAILGIGYLNFFYADNLWADRFRLIDNAYSYLGVEETTENRGPVVDQFWQCCHLPFREQGWQWCGGFMCKNYKEVGLDVPKGPCGSYNWADEDRRTYEPLPGDAVCIYVDSKGRIGHVGMHVTTLGNSNKSIEGNVGDMVKEVMRFPSEGQYYDWISKN